MTLFRLLALAGALALLVLGGCQCGDPCDGVSCPTGLECRDGSCVPVETDGGEVDECDLDVDCAGVPGRTHCDAATNKCVECTVTAHCSDPLAQVCDVDTHTCITRPPCTSNDDCADLLGSPFCEPVSGACVSCTDDTHCPGTQLVCDQAQFVCRFDPCASDADCDPYPVTPFCETRSGVCQSCTNDAHCGANEECRSGACQARGECSKNDDCGAGQVCDLGLAPPACVQCASSADCRLGGLCQGGTCGSFAVCQGDADCEAPLHCFTQTATCTACSTDSHCAAGQACDTQGRCTAPASCDAANLCLENQGCTGGACADVACTDDSLEPNDLPYVAKPVGSGPVNGLTLCPNTWDWYVVAAKVGDGLVVDVTYDVTKGHPKLLVWAGTGTGPALVGQPSITGTGQHLEVTTLSRAGPLWVGLRGVNTEIDYDLSVTVTPGGLCPDDALEPNDAPPSATQLPELVGGVSTQDAVACFGDEDWYAITWPAGLRTLAEATATGGGPSSSLVVAIFVQRAGGNLQLVGGSGTNVAEAPARGEDAVALIRVTQIALGDAPYRLAVRQRPPRPPNDSCFAPTTLSEGAALAGTTAGANDDGATGCGGAGSPDVVYRFSLAQTRVVNVSTTGALDAVLGIWGACSPASEVVCSDVPGASESVQAILGPGAWNVWVDGFAGEGRFDIVLTTSDPPPPPANEDCTSALALDPATGGGVERGEVSTAADDLATGCAAGGDAVYELTLTSPASLTASLAGTPGLGLALRADCASAASETVCETIPAGGEAALEVPYLDAGTWTLVVDGGGFAGGAYDLTWALGSAIPPAPNDDCPSSELLIFDGAGFAQVSRDTRNAADDLQAACSVPGQSGNDVVYHFVLAADRQVEAVLTAGFDAVLELRRSPCETGAPVRCSDATPPRIYQPALAGNAFYYLVVDGFAGERGPFTLEVTSTPPLLPPANDTCAAAEVLDVATGSAQVSGWTHLAADDEHPASTCTGSPTAGPDVVYAVDLLAGETLTGTVTPEPGYDPALYVLDACGAATCLAGADAFFVSDPETVSYVAAGDERVYLVVDGFSATRSGFFDLDVVVQP